MKKFTVQEIKNQFIKEQLTSNYDYVQHCLKNSKSLYDVFMEFSAKMGFSLKEKAPTIKGFDFTVHLADEHNSEKNEGEMVFISPEFKKVTAPKKVPPPTTTKIVAKKEIVPTDDEVEEQNQD